MPLQLNQKGKAAKRRFTMLFAMLFTILLPWNGIYAEDMPYTYPTPPDILSEAAVLIEAETGQIIFGKNENKRMEPASLTKIMTCLLAAELWDGSEDDMITVTSESLFDIDYESTTMDLNVDEELPISDMLYGLMLPSANDAANVIAIYLAGEIEDYVEMMNARAAELKLTGTHFSNPHGLPSPTHYSTAYDIAMITREGLNHEKFLEFAGAPEYVIPENQWAEERKLVHTNRLMQADDERYYPGIVAGKTGWTRPAGHCLMTAAERDGMTLICVVMKAGSAVNEYSDTVNLLDYGFANFKKANIDCTSYDNTEIQFTDQEGRQRKAILSLRERKFPAVVPKDAQGDMMVFSLPNIETISDGDYEDALLSWSDSVAGAPRQPLRTVPVRVWVEKIKPANAAADVTVDSGLEAEPPKRNNYFTWVAIGSVVLVGGIVWRRKRL